MEKSAYSTLSLSVELPPEDYSVSVHYLSNSEVTEESLRELSVIESSTTAPQKRAIESMIANNCPKKVKDGTIGEKFYVCSANKQSYGTCTPQCLSGVFPSDSRAQCKQNIYEFQNNKLVKVCSNTSSSEASIFSNGTSTRDTLTDDEKYELYNDGIRKIDIHKRQTGSVKYQKLRSVEITDSDEDHSDGKSCSPKSSLTTKQSKCKRKKEEEESCGVWWLVLIVFVIVLIALGLVWYCCFSGSSTPVEKKAPVSEPSYTPRSVGTVTYSDW